MRHIHRSEVDKLKDGLTAAVDEAAKQSKQLGIDGSKLQLLSLGLQLAIGQAVYESKNLPLKSFGGIATAQVDTLEKRVDRELNKRIHNWNNGGSTPRIGISRVDIFTQGKSHTIGQ